jgi:uncharacterized membrane protein
MRRPALDWLRGIGVLIMIEGHSLDSWTRVSDRNRDGYEWAILIAGFGAPIFLLLAGVTLALAAGSRLRKAQTPAQVASAAMRRGLWIFGLAFLFRLQSWAISGGPFPRSLLKVDILNVMGLSMVAAAILWRLGGGRVTRIAVLAAATAAIAMVTPLVRTAGWLAAVPDPVEWYLRPSPGATTFTLFPWAGFLTAGAALGTWLDAAQDPVGERRVHVGLLTAGAALGLGGYAASYLPPLYDEVSFWTSSPTFFFLRLGVVVGLVPLADALTRKWPAPALQEFGRASLFVYWIHVEMAYGVLTMALHRRLPFEVALVALTVFGFVLFGLVRLKQRFMDRWRPTGAHKSREPAVGAARPRLS